MTKYLLYQNIVNLFVSLVIIRKNYIQKYFGSAIDTDKHNYYKKEIVKYFNKFELIFRMKETPK